MPDTSGALDSVCLFAPMASRDYAATVAAQLGTVLSAHEEREFEDGEHKMRPLVNVRRKDVYVIASLYGEAGASVNDKLCRLLFFLATLRDAGAARVSAVVPYLCYARKDRKTQPRDPVTTRYVAALFEAVGVDRVVTLDVHNLAAFQNAFRVRTEHLVSYPLFVAAILRDTPHEDFAVVSPDVGGAKRAEQFRQALSNRLGRPVAAGFVEKYRARGVVSGDMLVGDVRGRRVLLVDDMISTGNTMVRAATACGAAGATAIDAVAAHGVFSAAATIAIGNPVVEKYYVTDTVIPYRLERALRVEKLHIVSTAALMALAIRRLHEGGSLSELAEIKDWQLVR